VTNRTVESGGPPLFRRVEAAKAARAQTARVARRGSGLREAKAAEPPPGV